MFLLLGCGDQGRATGPGASTDGGDSASVLTFRDAGPGGNDVAVPTADAPGPALLQVDATAASSPAADASRPAAKEQQLSCALSCDDGNPCTADFCGANSCQYALAGVPIYRHYNSKTQAHAYSRSAAAPPGFSAEAVAFRLLDGAHAPAMLHQLRGPDGDHMLSFIADEGVACCGYSYEGGLGRAFDLPTTGTVPLYRLFRAADGRHLSSLAPTEGQQEGYQLEGVGAYVCPP